MPFDPVLALLFLNSHFSKIFSAGLIILLPYYLRGASAEMAFQTHGFRSYFLIIGYLLLVTTVNFYSGASRKLVSASFLDSSLFSPAVLRGALLFGLWRSWNLHRGGSN